MIRSCRRSSLMSFFFSSDRFFATSLFRSLLFLGCLVPGRGAITIGRRASILAALSSVVINVLRLLLMTFECPEDQSSQSEICIISSIVKSSALLGAFEFK